MKYIVESRLRNFPFRSGAKDHAEELTPSELDKIEEILEGLYPEGMEDTFINDLFWFDFDTILEWLNKTGEEDEEEEEEED